MIRVPINLKLLLYTLAVTATSLLGVGYFIDSEMHEFHHDTALQEINESFTDLRVQVDLLEQKLVTDSQSIASEERVVAALNLISNYQNPDDYNSILFDEEKKKIASRLLSAVKTGAANEAFVYDDKDVLAGFVAAGDEDYTIGLVSYSQGEATLRILGGNNVNTPQGEPIRPAIAARTRQHREDKDGIDYHAERGGLLMEYHQPVMRKLVSGEGKRVGTLVLARWLDAAFLEMISGPNQSLTVIDGSLSTLGPTGSLEVERLSDAQKSALRDHKKPEPLYIETESSFVGVLPMAITHGDHVHFVFEYPLSLYRAASNNTRWAVFVAVLITGLIVLPLSMYLLRHLISAPLKRLVLGADRFRQGDYDKEVEVGTQDELGELATAMNLMAKGIRTRERDLSAIIEHIPMMLFVKDAQNLRFVQFNSVGEQLIGKKREELIDHGDHDFFPKEQADYFVEKDREVLRSGVVLDISEEVIDTPLGERILHTRKVPIMGEDGNPHYLLGVSEDITEQKAAEDKLRKWEKAFDSTMEGVMITDLEGNIENTNSAFTFITGFSQEDALGENPRILKSGRHDRGFYMEMWNALLIKGTWRGEMWNRRKSGEAFPVWQAISTVYDDKGKPSHYVSVFSDISPIKETQEKLDFLAHHDPLTGLPNRTLLNDRMDHAIERASRESRGVAVMFLDLDRFKDINDSLGHPVGDKLLTDVAVRLRSSLREVDTLSRQGGDEFILLMEDVLKTSDVVEVAQKILEVLTEPFHVSGREMIVSGSLGISLYPNDGADATTLIRNADAAMYRAKENGRNQLWFYTEDITHQATQRMDMEQALRDTVTHGELIVYYQPQIKLPERELVGAEALVRWERPGHGLIAPDEFIPLAEETGIINTLGEWVLYSACRQMKRWLEEGLPLKRLAVNISPVQIRTGNLVKIVQGALEATGLDPAVLELEVTEAIFLDDPESAGEKLRALDALGVQLALDDFGTGFSSLSYLQNFRFDRLKIDRSFMKNVGKGASNEQNIAKSVIALGQSLNMSVLAEGVETEEQLQWLRERGCDEAQGFLFGRPVPVDQFEGLIES
ncbi:MAG: EAL domain-containing protein [Candidatus Thiodiazotropha endolucinida]